MGLLFKARNDFEMMQLCLSTELAVAGVALICDNLGRPCVITAVSSSHRRAATYVLPAALLLQRIASISLVKMYGVNFFKLNVRPILEYNLKIGAPDSNYVLHYNPRFDGRTIEICFGVEGCRR